MDLDTARRWVAAVLIALGAAALTSACATTTPATGPAAATLSCPSSPSAPFTVIVGARSNSVAPSLSGELFTRLTDTVKARGRIAVIRLDGDPQPVFDRTPEFAAANGTALDDEINAFVDDVTAAITGPAHATVPEVDDLRALSFASRTTVAGSTVALLDSGLQTVAPLDFRKDDLLLADPGETVDYLRKQDLLPALQGRSLALVGIGETAPPQAHLDDRLRRDLQRTWEEIGKAAGACVDTVPTGAKEESVTGAPAVSPVALPAVPAFRPCGDVVLGEQNDVGFERDSTTFRDGPGARARIAAIADAVRNGTQHIDIIGTTARWGPRDGQLDLSRRRAETVRDVLVADGIAADRFAVSGVGSFSPDYHPDGGPDHLDPGLAVQNRRVIVRLPKCP